MSQSPVALITGTSSGVGLYTALRLAKVGYRTVATMRDTAKSADLLAQAKEAGVEVMIERLDVQDQGSIDTCVAKVIAEQGGIDLLVNNAGAGFLGSLEQTSDADLHKTMDINFYGVWRMNKAVFPHMRARGSGRIITVTSVGGLIGQPFNDAYCAAKFAVEGAMEALAPLAKRLGIQVSLIEPGPINTEFVNSAQAASDISGFKAPYGEIVARYMGSAGNVFAQFGQTGDDIAAVILEAATAESPNFRYITSAFANQIVAPKVVDPTGNNVIEVFASRL